MNAPAAPLLPDAASAPAVQMPPVPRTLAETGLSPVMLRDIMLKTMFRTNDEHVSTLARI